MPALETPLGDALLELLGLPVTDAAVQDALARYARGMQPELDPENEQALVDWVTVNEIGLEFGFEDGATLRAEEPSARRQAPPLLSQLYFYYDTPKTQPFPYELPFGLSFADDRAAVRRKLGAYEGTRRSYIRDAWNLPAFDVTIAYAQNANALESIYCHLRFAPWPAPEGEAELVRGFTPDAFIALWGRRWSSAELRARFAPLGYEQVLPKVRSEGVADLLRAHGVELSFAPGAEIAAADRRFPKALALASVTYYSSRELDAAEWLGPLPHALEFSDTQDSLRAKMGSQPAQLRDSNLSGIAVWHFESHTLSVMYSNLENRILRVTLMAPGYWSSGQEEEQDEQDED